MELSCTKIVNMPDNTKPKDKAQILLMLIYMTRIVIITWFLAKIYWCANPWRDKKDNHEKEIILLRVKITAWKAFQITRIGFKHLIVLFEAICNNSKTKIFRKKIPTSCIREWQIIVFRKILTYVLNEWSHKQLSRPLVDSIQIWSQRKTGHIHQKWEFLFLPFFMNVYLLPRNHNHPTIHLESWDNIAALNNYIPVLLIYNPWKHQKI